MKRVYVASAVGPLDGRQERIDAAVAVGQQLAQLGLAPFVPHLLDAWFRRYDYGYEAIMAHCFEWVRSCDAVFRVRNQSPGAEREVALARELGLPVFTDITAIAKWVRGETAAAAPGELTVDGVRCRVRFEFTHHGQKAYVVEAPHGPQWRALADGRRIA